MNRESWVDSIVEAMQLLGGDAHYDDLYPMIKKVRVRKNLSVPASFDETVRRCIQDHSKDSQGFKGRDIFVKLDRGHWGLKAQYKDVRTFGDQPLENQSIEELVRKEPIHLQSVEDDVSMSEDGKQLSDMEEVRVKKAHYRYEGRLSQSHIKRIKIEKGYVCEACGMSFGKSYPGIGDEFIECHHKIPYAEIEDGGNRKLKINDFMVLCSNCHRMIHRLDDPADLDALKAIIAKAAN